MGADGLDGPDGPDLPCAAELSQLCGACGDAASCSAETRFSFPLLGPIRMFVIENGFQIFLGSIGQSLKDHMLI